MPFILTPIDPDSLLRLAVNGYDLSTYLRSAHDEGFDPAASDYATPQFTGAAAFSDGQAGVGESFDNREIVIPLMLKADTTEGIHALIREINAELGRGSDVEMRMVGTEESTHFDVEGGRLEVDYQYWVARAAHLRATLRLWTRPFGHTGTSRPIASLQATAVAQIPATGVLGDVPALSEIEVRVGSRVASGGRVVGYGPHRSASFNAVRGPSAPDFVAQSGATVRGASGAIGSQYLALPVSPTTASGVALTSFLTPAEGHVGRHRVLAVARSRLDRPIALSAKDRFGAPLGPTAYASQVDGARWGLVDLGEIQVPERRAGQESVPTQYVEIRGGGASGNTINASPALEVNRLIYLPLDESPGVLRTQGAGVIDGLAANLLSESFTPRSPVSLANVRLELVSQKNTQWSRITADAIGLSPYGVGFAGTYGLFAASPYPNASAFYSLASGRGLQNTKTVAQIVLTGSAAAASGGAIELWAKQRAPSLAGFALRFVPGPSQTLQLLSYPGGAAPSVMASAGIASTLASGIYAGQPHQLILNADGGELSAYIGTAPVNPVLTASHADVTAAGCPALKLSNCSNIASGLLVIDSLAVYDLAVGASDMGPREWFRFESHPERRAFQGNASVFLSDHEAAFRGVHPRLPAVGSPGASGPAQLVVFSGDPTDFLGNDLLDVNVSVTEQFRFLR